MLKLYWTNDITILRRRQDRIFNSYYTVSVSKIFKSEIGGGENVSDQRRDDALIDE